MRNFIIIIFIVIIGATVGTIIVGSRTFDGVVVDRPYEAGLSWDETQKRQSRLGWKVEVLNKNIRLGSNELMLMLADRNGTALQDATVMVTVSRPSTRDYDRTYRAVQIGDGRYLVPISIPLVGLWDLRTEITRRDDLYIALERVEAAE